MTSYAITSWQIEGEKVEAVTDFVFLGSKMTYDGDCNHEIKGHLLLWKESYDKPIQHIQKQRHYFANKGPYSQSYGFSSSQVWMWMLDHKEGWAPNNGCFWTVVLEKTLENLLEARRSNQSILKEILPEYSLEKLMQKPKFQYFGHLIWRADSLQKTLMLGKVEGKGEKGSRGWDS